MNCNICGKEKAVLHIVETIDEKRDKISVCKKCSKDFGIIEKCFESLEDNNNLISIFPNHKSTKLKKIKTNKKLSEVDIEKEILKHQSDIEILKSMEKYEEANELKKKIETLSEVLISKKI